MVFLYLSDRGLSVPLSLSQTRGGFNHFLNNVGPIPLSSPETPEILLWSVGFLVCSLPGLLGEFSNMRAFGTALQSLPETDPYRVPEIPFSAFSDLETTVTSTSRMELVS